MQGKDQTPVRTHHSFEILKNNYLIKIANTPSELQSTFILRQQVYSTKSSAFKNTVDTDVYDLNADHLIVVDLNSNKIVGTYRLLLSDKVDRHYAQREFNISSFLNLEGRKLELGRACVDQSMRSGVIISLLWRGIGEYIKLSKTEHLFGCSTIWNADLKDAWGCYKYFEKENLLSSLDVRPLADAWPQGWEHLSAEDLSVDYDLIKEKIPTLVKTYVNAGIKFTPTPAYDAKLNAFEFFCHLKISDTQAAFKKKYLNHKD